MKNKLLCAALAVILISLIPKTNFGQLAPDLKSAAAFVLFSSNGSVSNSGNSQISGNIGSNSGTSSGFGNVNGHIHDQDSVSSQARVDIDDAYNLLNSSVCGDTISSSMGS